MANSVETRYPFLDEDVIAFASRIHPRWKLHGFTEDKYLLRQAAARILPAEIAQRRKAMFRAPLAESFLAHPPSLVCDLISPQSLARTGYFDAGAVRRLRGLGQEGRKARHVYKPRARRRGGDPALASSLSRRGIVRTAAS
jgi:asparagine synthetase B (glutamine-hydrolysing)